MRVAGYAEFGPCVHDDCKWMFGPGDEDVFAQSYMDHHTVDNVAANDVAGYSEFGPCANEDCKRMLGPWDEDVFAQSCMDHHSGTRLRPARLRATRSSARAPMMTASG